MDIYLESEIGECNNFTLNGKKERTSIVIAPLRVEGPESRLKFATGCNLFVDCENKHCYYSAAGRARPKVAGKNPSPKTPT